MIPLFYPNFIKAFGKSRCRLALNLIETLMRNSYIQLETPNIHISRKREIGTKYPAVKELMGQNPWSLLWISLITGFQLTMAFMLKDSSFWLILLAAFCVGAFCGHALFAQIHECCHNLVFKRTWVNKLAGIYCDTCLVLPGALAFRKYHMVHHRHMGEYSKDADIASVEEAAFIGNSRFKKFLWVVFFGLSQAFRPMRFDNIKLMDSWIFSNILYSLLVNILIFIFIGPMGLVYLGLSTFLGLGPHPVGGRWIQEHYVTKEGQETYSYYGPLNKLSFNVGFHNEHHDYMNIPWNNLPKLRKMAPEFYDNLHAYESWTAVLWNFVTDKGISVFDRILHPEKKTTA